MAEKFIKQVIDDFDSTEIADGAGEKIYLSVRGTDYVIDLRDANVTKFDKAINPFLEKATVLGKSKNQGKSSGTTKSPSGSSSSSGKSKKELAAVRAWAESQGISVNTRGRIKAEILDQYDAAHKA